MHRMKVSMVKGKCNVTIGPHIEPLDIAYGSRRGNVYFSAVIHTVSLSENSSVTDQNNSVMRNVYFTCLDINKTV